MKSSFIWLTVIYWYSYSDRGRRFAVTRFLAYVSSDELPRCTSGVFATITDCNLTKGYSTAKIKPYKANSTYGCKVASKYNLEIHLFSSYKSASRDQTINVTLQTQDKRKDAIIRLLLFSYETVYWHLGADFRTTVKHLTWVS